MKSTATFLLFVLSTTLLIAQPEIKIQLGHTDAIESVVYSSNGRYILSGSRDKTIKLWDVQTGKEIRTFTGHSEDITSLAFSPDCKFVLSGSEDKTLKLWDIASNRELKIFKGHSLYVTSVAYSPDGRYVVSGSRDNTIKFWDIASGKELKTINVYSDSGIRNEGVNSVAISPDGKNVISGAEDKSIKLWDVQTGKRLKTFTGHFGKITSVAFSPDGKYVLSGSEDETLKLWDVASGSELKTFNGHSSRVASVAFSPDGRYAMSGSWDSTLKIWDVVTGSELKTFEGHTRSVNSVAFSPDGRYILSGSDDIKLWDVQTGNLKKTFKGYSSEVSSVAFSPDGKYALMGSGDKTLKLWDIAKCKTTRTFIGHSSSVTSVAFSPDGRYAISGSWDKTIKIWDITTGSELKTFKGHTVKVSSVAFSPDGKYALSGSWDKTIILWDIASGSELKTFIGHMDQVYSVAFSPDGKYALSGSIDKTVILWNIKTGRKQKSFKSDGKNSFYSVAYSPDGKYVLGSSDNLLFLWDVNNSKFSKYVSGYYNDVISYQIHESITSVVFSPDGKYALSGSEDKTLVLWDVQNNLKKDNFNTNSWSSGLKRYKGHSYTVNSVAFSPDGKYALSGSEDRTIRFWNINTGELIYSAITSSDGESLCWTPEGFFMGSERLAREAIHIVFGMNVISIDQLFETYNRPDIVAAKINGENIKQYTTAAMQQGLKLPPLVKITSPQHASKQVKEQVTITVEVTDKGGGIDDIRLYHNGKLLEGSQRGIKAVSIKDSVEIKKFTLSLIDGENRIKVTAFNTQRTEAVPSEINVYYNAPQQAKTNMYILAIGINTYQNPKYNLNYALNDAIGFVEAMEKGATDIFNTVNKTFICDAQATRAGIMAAIEKIKATAKAEDIFVFYYAGHGVMSSINAVEKSEFYLVPHDVIQMYEADDLLKTKGISAKEIMEFSKTIKAQKQLFILDACQSGGAVQTFAMRGAAEEKAIAQLARSTGTYFLAASGTEQFASEVVTLGHGVFTYSIIKALEGDCKSQENKITVNLLKSCIEAMVPELTKKYKGEVQYPTGYGFGQDFPIVLVKQK